MPAGRYLFIPFLRTKSQKRQTKNRSSEKPHKKKDRQDLYNCYKLRLRAIKKLLLKAAREQKNFAHLEKNFSHINFSLSQKQQHEQKPLSSLHSSLLFSTKIPPNSFTRFISHFTPIKLI